MVDKSPLFYMRVYSEESTSEDWGGYFDWYGVEIVDDTVQMLYDRYAGERTSTSIFLQNLAEIYESWIEWEVEGDFKVIEEERAKNPDDLLFYRLHLEGNDVYTERLVDGFWVDKTYLFTYPGEPGRWFDLTFDQLGRPFVSWEIDGQVWIYWYDTIAQQMAIWNVCPGRTPVCSIDTFHDYQSAISDILLFYIDDEADRVKYRLQRDRYGIEYETKLKGYLYPVEQPNATDKDLVMAHMASNWRFYLWYRIKTREEFTISYWHSALYPIPTEKELLEQISHKLMASGSQTTVWWYYPELEDKQLFLHGHELVEGGSRVSIYWIGTVDQLMRVTGMTEEEILAHPGVEILDQPLEDSAFLHGHELIEGGIRVSILVLPSIEEEELALQGHYLEGGAKELMMVFGWMQDEHDLQLHGHYLLEGSKVEVEVE